MSRISKSETETFLLLKYGTINEAYRVWHALPYGEQSEVFNTPEYEILMEYEYNMHTNGPGPFEPR